MNWGRFGGIPIAYIRHNLPMYYEKDIEGGAGYSEVHDVEHAYEDYCTYSNDMASEKVKDASLKYSIALDEYIAAVTEDS